MPRVIVNISSIVTGEVIQSLSTLELTAERHFCSILKHESDAKASTSGGCQSSILNCDGCPSRGSPVPLTRFGATSVSFASYLSD